MLAFQVINCVPYLILLSATVTLGLGLTRCIIAEIGIPHQTVSNRMFYSARRQKMAYAYRRNRLWASESCMSVDKCRRTVGGVRIPHATVRVHSCTLPTVSLHLPTLTHGNRRMETVWRDRDTWRRCVYAHRTSRRNAYTTRRSAYT